jgi:hypothetical protein
MLNQIPQNGDEQLPSPPSRATMSELLSALQALRDGDFSVRLPGDWTGIEGKIADTVNEIASANQHMAHQPDRVGFVVGKEGQTTQRLRLSPASRGASAARPTCRAPPAPGRTSPAT